MKEYTGTDVSASLEADFYKFNPMLAITSVTASDYAACKMGNVNAPRSGRGNSSFHQNCRSPASPQSKGSGLRPAGGLAQFMPPPSRGFHHRQSGPDEGKVGKRTAKANVDTILALRRHLNRLGSEVKRLHTGKCYICGEWGRVARRTCCSATRHFECECEWQRQNPDKWTLVARVDPAAEAKRRLQDRRKQERRAAATSSCGQPIDSRSNRAQLGANDAKSTSGPLNASSRGSVCSLHRSDSLEIVLAARGLGVACRGPAATATRSRPSTTTDRASSMVDKELIAAARGWEYMKVPASPTDAAFLRMVRAMHGQGVQLFQVLPCSLCKEPWLVVPARGDFRPLLPSELAELEDQRHDEAMESYVPITEEDVLQQAGASGALEMEGEPPACSYGAFLQWMGVSSAAGMVGTLLALLVFLCLPVGLLAAACMEQRNDANDDTSETEVLALCSAIGLCGGVLLYVVGRYTIRWLAAARCRCSRCCPGCRGCCSSQQHSPSPNGTFPYLTDEQNVERARNVAELEELVGKHMAGGRGRAQSTSALPDADAENARPVEAASSRCIPMDSVSTVVAVSTPSSTSGSLEYKVGCGEDSAATVRLHSLDSSGPGRAGPAADPQGSCLRIKVPASSIYVPTSSTDPLEQARAVAHASALQPSRRRAAADSDGSADRLQPHELSTPQPGAIGIQQALSSGVISPGVAAALAGLQYLPPPAVEQRDPGSHLSSSACRVHAVVASGSPMSGNPELECTNGIAPTIQGVDAGAVQSSIQTGSLGRGRDWVSRARQAQLRTRIRSAGDVSEA